MVVKIKKGLPKVVTANDLKSGLAVFLKSDGSWSRKIDEAAYSVEEEELENLLKTGQQAEALNVVIGAYLVDVEQVEGQLRPVHIREFMRATGPSVREDLWQ